MLDCRSLPDRHVGFHLVDRGFEETEGFGTVGGEDADEEGCFTHWHPAGAVDERDGGTGMQGVQFGEDAAAAEGVAYFAEFRAGLVLGDWNTAGVIDMLVSEDTSFQQRKASITLSLPGGTSGWGFMRLRVEAPVIP